MTRDLTSKKNSQLYFIYLPDYIRYTKEYNDSNYLANYLAVKKIVEESIKQNVASLTLYAFSSENWSRPKKEINAIKSLVISAIDEQIPELIEQKVRLNFFGHLEDFGEKIINKIPDLIFNN